MKYQKKTLMQIVIDRNYRNIFFYIIKIYIITENNLKTKHNILYTS